MEATTISFQLPVTRTDPDPIAAPEDVPDDRLAVVPWPSRTEVPPTAMSGALNGDDGVVVSIYLLTKDAAERLDRRWALWAVLTIAAEGTITGVTSPPPAPLGGVTIYARVTTAPAAPAQLSLMVS